MNSQEIDKIEKTNKLKLIWGLVCLITPTALFVLPILAYAVVNFIASSDTAPACVSDSSISNGAFSACSSESNVSVGKAIVNVILFIVGAFTVATWLPGVIVGIILLATRKRVPAQ